MSPENPERRKQHQRHIERRKRMAKPMCRAIPAPMVCGPIEPFAPLHSRRDAKDLSCFHDHHIGAYYNHRWRSKIIKIINAVAAAADLTQEDITGHCRLRKFVRPRQIAVYLARRLTRYSTSQIAKQIGGRDHTTIIHSIRTIRKLKDDPDVAGLIKAAARLLRSDFDLSDETELMSFDLPPITLPEAKATVKLAAYAFADGARGFHNMTPEKQAALIVDLERSEALLDRIQLWRQGQATKRAEWHLVARDE